MPLRGSPRNRCHDVWPMGTAMAAKSPLQLLYKRGEVVVWSQLAIVNASKLV